MSDRFELGTQGRLSIDLSAIVRNWQRVRARVGGTEASAVVKADGYGLGAVPVSKALHNAGCKTFFVATLLEGEALRAALPEVVIYILNGFPVGGMARLRASRLRPVLGSVEELQQWAESGAGSAAVHIDTGMNRLGLRPDEFAGLALPFTPALLMTHLACADDAANPMSAQQIGLFHQLCASHGAVQKSFANSATVFSHHASYGDLVRPGVALYGGNPLAAGDNPSEVVVELTAPVLQVRSVKKGESVGYGAAWVALADARIATVATGYADGFLRGSANQPLSVGVEGVRCPLVGRISMDLLAVDISALPHGAVKRGTAVSLIDQHTTVEHIARAAGTIGYEVLTRLGHRTERHYRGH